MSNPNSKVILRLSPKRKRSRANEPFDVRLPTPTGFKIFFENQTQFIEILNEQSDSR